MRTHLVIPDSHAKPDVPNDRFELLGKFILDVKPDVIINIGDMADMASLCSYDKGTKSFEGRRYRKDIEAVEDAQYKLFKPMQDYNKKRKLQKKGRYNPRLITCLGNHEDRINRVIQYQPELEGTISIEDLKHEEYGWEVYPFKTAVEVDGILYSHYFSSGVMGKAISGVHIAHSLLQKKYKTCTQGHSHLLDYTITTGGDGKKIQGLSCGCFLEKDQYEDYAGEANDMWWRGIVLKYITDDGYDPDFISIDRLEKMYDVV